MSSIVRHVDKKTGLIIVYESTSNYDAVTKKSRPKKKYLGTIDRITGEFKPSSGKRGRQAGTPNYTIPKPKSTQEQNTTSDPQDYFKQLDDLRSQVSTLSKTVEQYQSIMYKLKNALDSLPELS